MRKVVVTGLGMVTPMGTGVQKSWSAVLNSLSGIDHIQSISTNSLDVKLPAKPLILS